MPKFKERERKDGRHVIAPRGFNRKRPRKERIEVEYDDESEYSESEEELEFNNGQLIQDNAYQDSKEWEDSRDRDREQNQ